MVAAQGEQGARPAVQVALPRLVLPRHPGGLVVEAVGVVVAALRAAGLVSGGEHGHPGREQQGGEKAARQPAAQRQNVGVVGQALDPAVPGPVVVRPVAPALAVGVVVLAVVGDQVAQGEAVVGGDEVDRCERAAATGLEDVGRAAERVGQVAGTAVTGPGLAVAPEPDLAHRVAEAVVPLGPRRGKRAELVAAGAYVPRLRHQLDPRQHRVLADDGEERPGLLEAGRATSQCRRQVEPEAVDVHLLHPVAQRVRDHCEAARVPQVQRVATAGHVLERPVVAQPVVGLVVQAAPAGRRPVGTALAGVVVDDVEQDLETGLVQRPNHGLELVHLLAA